MIKKISAQQLIKGMFVCGNDRKWLDTPFFRSKFLIDSDKKINEIQEYCQFVLIDTEKGLDAPVQAETSFLNDDDPASKIYRNSKHEFDAILQSVTSDQAMDYGKVKNIVKHLLDGLNHYPDAILDVALQTSQACGLAANAVNICLQALALGKRLKLDRSLLQTLSLAAILSSIGSTASFQNSVENPIENKSSQLMDNLKRIDAPIAEKIGQNNLLQAILLIASVFNDLRGNCAEGWFGSSSQALRQMASEAPSRLDADLLGHFMDMLGLYSIDSMVELNSGELGLVVDVDQQAPRKPALRVLTDTHKQLLDQPFVLKLTDPSAKKYSIARVLPVDEPILELIFSHLGQIDS